MDENRPPHCPSCGETMRFSRTLPRLGEFPELRTYACKACGMAVTHDVKAGILERAAL